MTPTRRSKNWSERFFSGDIGWVLGLFLIGLGAKFQLILQSNRPLPYYDQWEGEGMQLYVPWLKHTLTFADLIAPFNEHRIFFTRVYDLVLLWLNGQWDSELEMTANALLHCAAIAGFGWLLARLAGRRRWPLIWPPLALALVLPYNWENTLWGFQSQFYFLLIFSLLTMWLIGLHEPFSPGWLIGAGTGALALFTMASGFMASVAAAGLCLFDISREPRIWRRRMPTLITCAAITAGGFLLRPHIANPDQFLQAHTWRDFFVSLGKNLAWPWIYTPWVGLINFGAFAILVWACRRSPRDQPMKAERMLLMTGLWAIQHCVAAAYARGAHGPPPPARYMDITDFLMLSNWLGLALLLSRNWRRLPMPAVWCTVFAGGTAMCLAGIFSLASLAHSYGMAKWERSQKTRFESTRQFILTGKSHSFDHNEGDLAYPDAAKLVYFLNDPDLRRILPAWVRDPLKIIPNGAGDGAFVTNGWHLAEPDPPYEKSWGSFSGAGLKTRGTFESQPLQSALPYLQISVAGDLGREGLALEVVDVKTGKITHVQPKQAPGERWTDVYVKAPKGKFKVVARDESESGWFAFKEPREMGSLSFWSRRLLHAWIFFIVAGVVCVACGVAGLFRREMV